MEKRKYTILAIVFLTICNLFVTTQVASASLCVADWPNEIFDAPQTFSGSLLNWDSASNSQFHFPSSTTFTFAPQISQVYQDKIKSLGADVHVDQRYLLSFPIGLSWTNAFGASSKPSGASGLVQTDSGSTIEFGRNYRFGGRDGWESQIAYLPGQTVKHVVTVSTPGCNPRDFISSATNPTYDILSFDNESVQKYLKTSIGDFTKLDELKNLVKYVSDTQNVDLIYCQVGSPCASAVNLGLNCAKDICVSTTGNLPNGLSVAISPFNTNYPRPTLDWGTRLDFADCPDDFDTSQDINPMTGQGNIEITKASTGNYPNCHARVLMTTNLALINLGNLNVRIIPGLLKKQSNTSSIPTSKPSTVTCTKGSIAKKVTGSNPICPPGYKKK